MNKTGSCGTSLDVLINSLAVGCSKGGQMMQKLFYKLKTLKGQCSTSEAFQVFMHCACVIITWWQNKPISSIRNDVININGIVSGGDFNGFAMEEFRESLFLASRDEDVSKIWTSMVSKYWMEWIETPKPIEKSKLLSLSINQHREKHLPQLEWRYKQFQSIPFSI